VTLLPRRHRRQRASASRAGALRLDGPGVLDITDSVLARQTIAYQGGALFPSAPARPVIHSSLFLANDGHERGGGGAILQTRSASSRGLRLDVRRQTRRTPPSAGAIYTSAVDDAGAADTFRAEHRVPGTSAATRPFGGSGAVREPRRACRSPTCCSGQTAATLEQLRRATSRPDLGGSVGHRQTSLRAGRAGERNDPASGPARRQRRPGPPTLLPVGPNSQNLNTGANPYCSTLDARGVTRAKGPCDGRGRWENSAATERAGNRWSEACRSRRPGNGLGDDRRHDRPAAGPDHQLPRRVRHRPRAALHGRHRQTRRSPYDPVGGAQGGSRRRSAGLTARDDVHVSLPRRGPRPRAAPTTGRRPRTLTHPRPAPTVTTGDATDLTDSTPRRCAGSIQRSRRRDGLLLSSSGTTTGYGSDDAVRRPFGRRRNNGSGRRRPGSTNLRPGTDLPRAARRERPERRASPVVYGQDRTFTTTGSNTSEYKPSRTPATRTTPTCQPVTGGNLCTSLRAGDRRHPSGIANDHAPEPRHLHRSTHGQLYINGERDDRRSQRARDNDDRCRRPVARVSTSSTSDQLAAHIAGTVTGGDALDEPGGDILKRRRSQHAPQRASTGAHAAVGGGPWPPRARGAHDVDHVVADRRKHGPAYGAGVSGPAANGDGRDAVAQRRERSRANHGAGVLSDSSENSLQTRQRHGRAQRRRRRGSWSRNQRNSEVVDSIVADKRAPRTAPASRRNIAFDVEDTASCGFTGASRQRAERRSAAEAPPLVNRRGGETGRPHDPRHEPGRTT